MNEKCRHENLRRLTVSGRMSFACNNPECNKFFEFEQSISARLLLEHSYEIASMAAKIFTINGGSVQRAVEKAKEIFKEVEEQNAL